MYSHCSPCPHRISFLMPRPRIPFAYSLPFSPFYLSLEAQLKTSQPVKQSLNLTQLFLSFGLVSTVPFT